MKKKVFAGLMLLTVLVLAANLCLAANVLYDEKFTKYDPGWDATEGSKDFVIKDGKVVMAPEKALVYINRSFSFPDSVQASVTLNFNDTKNPSAGSGLIFWAKSYQEYYMALISPDGWFAVLRNVNGRYLQPVTWRTNDAIKKGTGVDNLIQVVTKGNQAIVSINGKEVVTFNGQPPAQPNMVGIWASNNTVTFSGLKVVQP